MTNYKFSREQVDRAIVKGVEAMDALFIKNGGPDPEQEKMESHDLRELAGSFPEIAAGLQGAHAEVIVDVMQSVVGKQEGLERMLSRTSARVREEQEEMYHPRAGLQYEAAAFRAILEELGIEIERPHVNEGRGR